MLLARNSLIEEYLTWARSIARKVHSGAPPCYALDDFVGAAEIALVQAADAWWCDQAPGWHGKVARFSSFAYRRILGACHDLLRRRAWRDSMGEPLPEVDTRVSPEVAPDTLCVWGETWGKLERLPLPQRHVLVLMYQDGLSVYEVAHRLQSNGAAVAVLHRQALASMREMMAGADH